MPRLHHRPLALALAGAAVMPAAAQAEGGVAVPEASGGAQYAAYVRATPPRPVARALSVRPSRVVEDASPSVRLRVDQRGVRKVSMRLVVLRVGTGDPVARVTLGRRTTGRTHTVRLPGAATRVPGTYLVRLHVKDPWNRTLRRRASASGRTNFTVVARPAPAPAPQPAPAPAPVPPGDGVFPVRGTWTMPPGGEFGNDRGSHTHQGQDITAPEGSPVLSPTAGRVVKTAYQATGAGYYVVVDGTEGRSFFFAHCQKDSFGVSAGQAVSAGQPVCRVGSTGRSSGPHLHFEIWLGGWRAGADSHPIDPLPSLRAWAR